MSRTSLRPRGRSILDQIVRGAYVASAALAVGLIIAVIGLGVGLAQGYRPVVLTSGSMSPTAPTGSLVVARPVDRVEVGDILVMARESRATVTHRIIDIERSQTGEVFAVTRGDANEEIDAEPFPLDGPQLVGRWIVPEVGSALIWLGSPMIGLVVVGGAVLLLTMSAISYIWNSSGRGSPAIAAAGAAAGGGDVRRRTASSGQKRFGLAVGLSVLFGFTGLAWSLYLGSDTVAGNAFSTADCFDARIGSVQTGSITSSTDGITTATITAVDPATSFVQWSVRSNSSKPGDSVVLADLSSATTIDFIRQTDTATPPVIEIEWSVVEYDCGVSVQRGLVPGNDTATVDIPVSSVDPTTSFVIGGVSALRDTGSFDNNDLSIVELVGGDTVRFRVDPSSTHPAGQMLGYQVVTFGNAGDLQTQVVSTTLGSGVTVDTITLPSPVDTASTFVLATAAADTSGFNIGERLPRVRLLDATTVEVQRAVSGGSVDVNVQVVELLEGSTVQRGTVTLAPTEASRNIAIPPVDASRTTVGSTVLLGGASSGGSTDESSSGVTGEALVTVDLIDPTNLSIQRASTASTASFAWQAITWGGPTWADPDAPFRQRIDVDAQSVDVPTGYTVPVTIDHEALVSSSLSVASGDDLRLWRFDGLAWTELDRVLDDGSSWNDVATTFWFRTQEGISANASISYWLYFGDPTPAAPLADPANVWLVDEGFESGLGAFEDRTGGTSWYRADSWSRRIPLTIASASVPSTLTDQTVLVRVTDADLAANAQADGSDLLFTDSGGSQLPHAIESWDAGTGTVTAWVRVPVVDGTTDTSLFLLYGAADAPRQEDPRAVWAGERAVWNLARSVSGPAPSLDDDGPENIDGVALDNASVVAGPAGFIAQLDGSLDRFESAPARLPGAAFTATVAFRADTIASDTVLLAQGDPSTTGVLEVGIDATTTPGSPFVYAVLNLDGAPVRVDGGAITPGTWHHLAAVWDQTGLRLHVDGGAASTAAAPGALPTSRELPFVLGADSVGARSVDGSIDQVRLRDVAVPVDQLAFEASNLASPAAVVVSASPTTGTFRDQGDWTVRRPITVSAGLADSDLTDFVLLVELLDSDLGSSSQVDGDDLVFTAADGVTRLDHHVERWDAGTGALTAWVRIPLLSSTVDTELFLYSGNASALDQTDAIGVWGETADLVLAAP